MKQIQWFDSRFYKVLTDTGIDYYPSVTTILQAAPKPGLTRWRGELGNEAADAAANEGKRRGSTIHAACEDLINGAVIALSGGGYDGLGEKELQELRAYRKLVMIQNQEDYLQVLKFHKLLGVLSPLQIETERTVYSTAYRYAGTMDYMMLLAEGEYQINGAKPVVLESGYYIADLKTGNSVSDDYFMQLAAYRQAVVENFRNSKGQPYDIRGGLIIHTNADTRKGIEGLAVKLRTTSELDQDLENFLSVYRVWNINPTATAPKIFPMPAYVQWKRPAPLAPAAAAEAGPDEHDVAQALFGGEKQDEPKEEKKELESAVETPQQLPPPKSNGRSKSNGQSTKKLPF